MSRPTARTGLGSRILAVGLGALGVWAAPKEPGALPRLARDLCAPLVLPRLWSDVDSARRNGSLGEFFERARTLVRFVPRWTDGPIHFAAMLAFEASLREQDPQRALDRLLAATFWLEQMAAERPRQAADLLTATANFVTLRTRSDDALGEAFARRTGIPPLAAADAWLARAEALVPLASTAQRRAWLALRQIASALRTGDNARATAVAELGLSRLAPTDSRLSVPEYRRALERALAAIQGKVRLDPLGEEPLLVEVAEALAARERGR